MTATTVDGVKLASTSLPPRGSTSLGRRHPAFAFLQNHDFRTQTCLTYAFAKALWAVASAHQRRARNDSEMYGNHGPGRQKPHGFNSLRLTHRHGNAEGRDRNQRNIRLELAANSFHEAREIGVAGEIDSLTVSLDMVADGESDVAGGHSRD